MTKKYDVGVIVGRFQVNNLTKAHIDIIEHVSQTHKRLVLMIGVAPTLGSKTDPLDYLTRMVMLRSAFPEAIISHIADVRSNSDWTKNLDSAIRALIPLGSVCLYGGRDSFIETYDGNFPTQEIPSIYSDEAGTQVREDIRNTVIDSSDFRTGAIYNSQNQYPKVFPTVDVAITRSCEMNTRSVLLGRKEPNSEKYSFIGGFVDPTDESYEVSAIRELSEEVDVEVDRNLIYITSARIDDWRYKSSEKIITTFYEARLQFGSGKPKEEFCETKWFPIDTNLIKVITEAHLPLAEALLKHYEKI